ncbi:hypothetical protein ACHQM5_013896 [Ranunculus cassubicifolius]
MATRCKHCNVVGVHEHDGSICCPKCGRVIVFNLLCDEPTFTTSSNGQSRLSGNLVKSIESTFSESYERTLRKGEDEIRNLVDSLGIAGGEDVIKQASKFHRIAVDRGFTKGRLTSLVTASCLYIVCRIKQKPYLLIDFSESLRTGVYELGAVFLQLCKLLRLEGHSNILVDPVLFLPRFAESLLHERNKKVERTAMKILASMKRDWMQTGRKPSGLCGAALYIAALSFGIDCKKSEIASVVHMCEDTLTKRLTEFENTESASLTVEEFTEKAEEFQFSMKSVGSDAERELLCKHKGSGDPHFSNGLCENCYKEFVEISGGIHGGSDPPAFQRAERNRSKNTESPNLGRYHERDRVVGSDESESLSDIDVDEYIHDKEETRMKKIIWERLNREYLDEQAMKQRVIQENEAKLRSYSDRVLTPEELVEAASAAVAKSRKDKRQKKADEVKKMAPAKTAAEAVSQMFMKKKLNSKINYDVLNKLFDDDDEKNSSKSTESNSTASNVAKRKSSEFDDIQAHKKKKDEDELYDDEIGEVDEYGEVDNANEKYDDTSVYNWDEEHEQYGNGMYYGDEGDEYFL